MPLSSDTLDQSLHSAADFLQDSCSTDGLWRDFRTLAGTSSSWVTGFVCHAVSCCPELEIRVEQTFNALWRRQRADGGWSFNHGVPSDCDSTAWALLAVVDARKWRPSIVQRGLRFLLAHQDPASGGFATYAKADGIQHYIDMPERALVGWFGTHPTVTAAAMQALSLHGGSSYSEALLKGAAYLRSCRDGRGLWNAYWWKGSSYASYQSLRALRLAGVCRSFEAARAIRSLMDTQYKDGSWADSDGSEGEAFATAFSMLSLMLYPDTVAKAASASAAWLMERQRADGSWPVVPTLRLPPPGLQEPSTFSDWKTKAIGTGVVVEDERRIFTTAAVIWALSIYKAIFT